MLRVMVGVVVGRCSEGGLLLKWRGWPHSLTVTSLAYFNKHDRNCCVLCCRFFFLVLTTSLILMGFLFLWINIPMTCLSYKNIYVIPEVRPKLSSTISFTNRRYTCLEGTFVTGLFSSISIIPGLDRYPSHNAFPFTSPWRCLFQDTFDTLFVFDLVLGDERKYLPISFNCVRQFLDGERIESYVPFPNVRYWTKGILFDWILKYIASAFQQINLRVLGS